MHNHVTAHDLAFIGTAIAGLLFLSWLFGGRKITAQPSAALPQTFVASRIVPAAFSIFAIFGFVICSLISISALFFMTDEDAGSHWFRLGAGTFLLLGAIFAAYGVKIFVGWTIWPDRLTLAEDGIHSRLRGQDRQWTWDMISDARILFVGSREGMLQLVLKEPDPEQVRRLARFPWGKKQDPKIIWLDDMWKPTALLTSGDMAVRDAIRAALEARGKLRAR